MRGVQHEALIAQLVKAHGASTRGFRTQVRNFLRATPGYTPDYDEDLPIPAVIPDAYRLDLGKITVWEVEVTNPITQGKLRAYAEFWVELDATDVCVELELRRVDRYGIEQTYDLVPCLYEWLAAECAPV